MVSITDLREQHVGDDLTPVHSLSALLALSAPLKTSAAMANSPVYPALQLVPLKTSAAMENNPACPALQLVPLKTSAAMANKPAACIQFFPRCGH